MTSKEDRENDIFAAHMSVITGRPTFYCMLCKEFYYGYGNNAQPVANGRCCDECNATKVIPACLAQLEGVNRGNHNETK